MKYDIQFTNQFKKDLKLAKKQNKNLDKLFEVIDILANGGTLDAKYRDHDLTGNYKGTRECHIEPDWILIYEIQNNVLVLMLYRLGTHSELFKKQNSNSESIYQKCDVTLKRQYRQNCPQDTPLSYKLNFKTTTEDITTPNLFKPLEEYHADISASGGTLNIPLENLILTYQNTSSTSVRISVAAKDTATPILTDMRRSTIFNFGSVEAQTFNNTTVSTRTVLDDLVYSQSQESHSMKIRQQDPVTKLWSLCEIHSFISEDGARTSVWIRWIETNVSYPVPSA